MPLFLLQIVHTAAPRRVVVTPGGGRLERDIIDEYVKQISSHVPDIAARVKASILSRGVGVGRTEAHVAADIDAAFAEVLVPTIEAAIKEAVNDTWRSLKLETIKVVK